MAREYFVGVVEIDRVPILSDMRAHDPTMVPPERFVAALLVEATCEYVCRLPFADAVFHTVFERTLRAHADDASQGVFVEMARAFEAEGYFQSPRRRTKAEMLDFAERVATRLRT